MIGLTIVRGREWKLCVNSKGTGLIKLEGVKSVCVSWEVIRLIMKGKRGHLECENERF